MHCFSHLKDPISSTRWTLSSVIYVGACDESLYPILVYIIIYLTNVTIGLSCQRRTSQRRTNCRKIAKAYNLKTLSYSPRQILCIFVSQWVKTMDFMMWVEVNSMLNAAADLVVSEIFTTRKHRYYKGGIRC